MNQVFIGRKYLAEAKKIEENGLNKFLIGKKIQ